MLVLVIDNCHRFFATRFLSSSLAFSVALILLTSGLPAPIVAQDYEGPTEDTYSTGRSVLHGNSELGAANSDTVATAAANGAASINDNPAANTLTAAPKFPNAPAIPQSFEIPESPNQETYTQPSPDISTNDLRGSSPQMTFGGQVESKLDPDRSDAIGTLATRKQNYQTQTPPTQRGSSPSSFQQPKQFAAPRGPLTPQTSRAPFQKPETAGFQQPKVGNFGGGSASLNSRPSPIQTNDQRPQIVSSAISDQPKSGPRATAWQTESTESRSGAASQTQSPPNRVASNQGVQSTGQAFNSSANSNYNRGLNQNIASGSPKIQPLTSQNPYANQARPGTRRGAPDRSETTFNRDSSVRPSGFAQPVSAAAPKKRKTDLAKGLIARYQTRNVNPAQLPGTPVKLVQMLSQPISLEQRRPMVHQFWDTYFDWASLVNSREYLVLLEKLQASGSSADQAMLQTAKMIAKNEVLASEIQLVKSQSKLNQFIPNQRPNQPLPIPDDLPLIQKYTTNYELYKQNRLMPVSLLGIDKMLPKTLELIIQRADTVEMSQQTNEQVFNGLRNRQGSLGDALSAAKQWRAAEQSLLVAVTDYNHAISDYSLTVTKGYYPPQQIVAMLIGSPKPANQNLGAVSQSFRNARNTNPVSQNRTQSQFDSLNQQRGPTRSTTAGQTNSGQSLLGQSKSAQSFQRAPAGNNTTFQSGQIQTQPSRSQLPSQAKPNSPIGNFKTGGESVFAPNTRGSGAGVNTQVAPPSSFQNRGRPAQQPNLNQRPASQTGFQPLGNPSSNDSATQAPFVPPQAGRRF